MHSLSQALLALVVSRLFRRPVNKVLVMACIFLDTKQNMPVAISAVSAIVNLLLLGHDKKMNVLKDAHGPWLSIVPIYLSL
jgi:hypothetical protein